MDGPDQDLPMTRESAKRPRKSRKRKSPFQQTELLRNRKHVAGEPAQQAAQGTAEFARMIVDGIPGLVALVSPAGEVEAVNRPLLEYFGKDLEEVRNWANTDAIYPDDLPLAIETFNNSLPTGRPFDVEQRLRRFDGVYRWFQSRGLPLRDPEGRTLHWYVLLTDIEERKQAEDKLRRSEAFLADGQRLSKTGTFSWSIETNEIIWSDELYSIFAFDRATPVTLELIGSRVHAEDLPMLEDMVARARRGEGTFAYEHRIVTPDGSIKYIHLVGHTVRDANGRLEYIGAAQDVTQRRLAEEQLRDRELNLRRVTQIIPGMLWSATPEGEVDYCNRPWLEFAAMTEEQAKGWGWATAIYPDDRNGLIESWHSSLASGIPLDMEARVRRFDGAYRWFLFRANPLRDESGNIIKWYGTNIDIEDRKRGEEALRASELSWRQIIDNIPGFVHTTSAMGEVEFLNQQLLEYFGKSSEELKDWSRLDIVHPDDLPRVIEAWRMSIETGQAYEVEQRNRRADGVYRWFQSRGRAVRNPQGEITAWYWVNTDINDRKRAEADLQESYLRLTEAQRLSKTGSFITDLVADEHNWSEETFRIFEFDPSTNVTVQVIQNVVHPEDLPSFESMISRAMTGEDVDFSFRILTPRGAVKHVRGMARVIERVAGRPLFIGALQDVTESRIAEEALNRARSELAHVARVTTLNALTASIAHEINQPLSGIMTNAGTCLRMLTADPPNVEGALETARRTIRDGHRASDVIARLRALYSKKDISFEPMDLNEATGEVISLCMSDLHRNRVILRRELAEDLPPIAGDRIQLQQVILNLLRNASDAMSTIEDRRRELVIGTERDDDDRVRLSVRDAGVGIDAQAADRLFEAFYTTKSDGMGMGLSVSHSIIEAHRGRLWATNNEGPGATFSFVVPCHHADASATQTVGAK
jgi:PAS domain S-box-containing protein